MRTCLAFVSLLIALLAQAQWLVPLGPQQRYRVSITTEQAELSGICIIKADSAARQWRGTMVNEFGVHAFDFTLSQQRNKVKLQNVMQGLNRWYIKREISRDLQYLFQATPTECTSRNRSITLEGDTAIVLNNTRRNIIYHFQPLTTLPDAATE